MCTFVGEHMGVKDSLLVSVVFVHHVDDQTQMARLGSKLLSVLRHLTTQE